MFAALRKLLTSWFGPPAETQAHTPEAENAEILRSTASMDEIHPETLETTSSHAVPYDENLLERARTQWQFGDWESLARIDRDTLQHHPDRAKLALLAAAGKLQTDNNNDAKQFIRLAQDWGINKKLISQILTAGVHNSLGRAAALGNQQQRALQHFENAITIGTPGADARLLMQARYKEQMSQVGQTAPWRITSHLGEITQSKKSGVKQEKSEPAEKHSAEKKLVEYQAKVNSLEELIALQKRQLYSLEEHQRVDVRQKLVEEVLSHRKFSRIFLDCGANDGCSAIKFLLTHPEFEVVSFEPNPELWDYHIGLPTYLSKSAVGAKDGLVTLLVDTIDADGSSLLAEKEIDNTGKRSNDELPSITVPCINLSELIRELRPHFDMIALKLDVEGMEYSILEGMIADGTLPMIDEIYCEFHWMKMGYPERRHTELIEVIRSVVTIQDWDALEFSIHGKKSGTLKKIRNTLVQSIISKRSLFKDGK